MLTPQDLRSIHLRRRPLGQRLLADLYVRPSWWLRRVRIEVEGMEHLVGQGPRLIAMNHTDRYNYWGLQVQMYRQHDQFTASWVKGKYYERWFSRSFMRSTSNIPVPSRGYVIAGDFLRRAGRPPSATEYRQLRDLVDQPTNREVPEALRGLLGGDPLRWAQGIESAFAALSDEVVQLTGEALATGLHVLIFPEGTRSPRLTRGHVGIAQIAQYFNVPIVPVGCSGSPRVYPGDVPWPSPGTVRYRVGRPIDPRDPALADLQVAPGFRPLSRQAQVDHGPRFQGLVDRVMDRIATLVDPEHLPTATDRPPDGVDRFI